MGVLFLLILSVSILGCNTPPADQSIVLAEDYARLGQDFYQSGELSQAVNFLSRAYEISPNSADIGYNLARALIDNKQVDQGVSLLKGLLTENPQNILLIEALAYGYQLLGEDYEALDLLTSHRESLGRLGTYNLLLAYYRAGRFADGAQEASGLPQTWLEADTKLAAMTAVLRGEVGEIDEAGALLESLNLGQEGFFLSYLAEVYQKQERTLEEVALRERLYRLPYRASDQALELARRFYSTLQDSEMGFTWLTAALDEQGVHWSGIEEEFLPVLAPSQVQELREQEAGS